MKLISEQSKDIATEAKRDSAAMKALTLAAVVALPATVVSVNLSPLVYGVSHANTI